MRYSSAHTELTSDHTVLVATREPWEKLADNSVNAVSRMTTTASRGACGNVTQQAMFCKGWPVVRFFCGGHVFLQSPQESVLGYKALLHHFSQLTEPRTSTTLVVLVTYHRPIIRLALRRKSYNFYRLRGTIPLRRGAIRLCPHKSFGPPQKGSKDSKNYPFGEYGSSL